MEQGPPPLFNQGVPARARLAFFSFLAAVLIIVDARVRSLETIRAGVGVVLWPVQVALQVPRAVVDTVADYVGGTARLAQDNETLRRQAVEQAKLVQQSQQLLIENGQLRQLLGLRERVKVPTIAVQSVQETRDVFSRRLVIDKGTQDGIKPGHPVIDAIGVVGQVTRAFPMIAEVTLLTDRDMSVPVQVLRNGLRGVAFGGVAPGTLDLRFMAANADVIKGDQLVTSGLDGVYPPGLPVALVDRVERIAGDQFARIALVPSAGVQSTRHLLVLQVEAPALPPPSAPRRDDPVPKKGAKK
jgi:rod shape-determining protein MreC